jgi:fatty acyl-CoA reductase
VQVSTCYVNGYHRGVIAEEIAPPARATLPRHADGAFDVDALIERLQREIAALNRRELQPQSRARSLIDLGIREARAHGWNDTYTFTKWLGEQIACRETRDGTSAIVRPAIVESACREPQPGWIEGVKIGDAIVLAYARGKTTLFLAKTSGVADIIPVDLVANSIILAGAEALLSAPKPAASRQAHQGGQGNLGAARRFLERRGQRRIYQAGSSVRNPVRVGDYVRLCRSEMRDNAQAYEVPHETPAVAVPDGVAQA